MAKHRILILTNRVPYPLNDGGSLAINAMLEGYIKAGWEVFLFSMNTSRHFVPVDTLPSFYKEIGFETFDIKTDIRLVPTLKNFFLSRKPNHAERFYDKGFGDRLKTIIDQFEPHLVQLESVYLATYLPAIKEATNENIAIRLHNIEYQIWERLANEASSFRKYYFKDLCSRIKKFEVNAWSEADILIPITDEDAAVVAQLLPEKKIIVAPFGIDISKVKSSKAFEGKWIGYHIGAMDWLPNAEGISWFLDNVWGDLHKEVPSFEFHFAGRNMPGSFEKYEQDGVVCAGEVESAQQFIADKKVLIVPLRSGSGIRIKILEAMAAGKLVVSTSVGMQGISGVVPGIHFLLAEEKEDFIRQIKWLMEHKQEAEVIARAGSELVRKEYDEEKIMSRLISKMGLNES
jgi:glycosyltransferase involved in cell wall biosynthesis